MSSMSLKSYGDFETVWDKWGGYMVIDHKHHDYVKTKGGMDLTWSTQKDAERYAKRKDKERRKEEKMNPGKMFVRTRYGTARIIKAYVRTNKKGKWHKVRFLDGKYIGKTGEITENEIINTNPGSFKKLKKLVDKKLKELEKTERYYRDDTIGVFVTKDRPSFHDYKEMNFYLNRNYKNNPKGKKWKDMSLKERADWRKGRYNKRVMSGAPYNYPDIVKKKFKNRHKKNPKHFPSYFMPDVFADSIVDKIANYIRKNYSEDIAKKIIEKKEDIAKSILENLKYMYFEKSTKESPSTRHFRNDIKNGNIWNTPAQFLVHWSGRALSKYVPEFNTIKQDMVNKGLFFSRINEILKNPKKGFSGVKAQTDSQGNKILYAVIVFDNMDRVKIFSDKYVDPFVAAKFFKYHLGNIKVNEGVKLVEYTTNKYTGNDWTKHRKQKVLKILVGDKKYFNNPLGYDKYTINLVRKQPWVYGLPDEAQKWSSKRIAKDLRAIKRNPSYLQKLIKHHKNDYKREGKKWTVAARRSVIADYKDDLKKNPDFSNTRMSEIENRGYEDGKDDSKNGRSSREFIKKGNLFALPKNKKYVRGYIKGFYEKNNPYRVKLYPPNWPHEKEFIDKRRTFKHKEAAKEYGIKCERGQGCQDSEVVKYRSEKKNPKGKNIIPKIIADRFENRSLGSLTNMWISDIYTDFYNYYVMYYRKHNNIFYKLVIHAPSNTIIAHKQLGVLGGYEIAHNILKDQLKHLPKDGLHHKPKRIFHSGKFKSIQEQIQESKANPRHDVPINRYNRLMDLYHKEGRRLKPSGRRMKVLERGIRRIKENPSSRYVSESEEYKLRTPIHITKNKKSDIFYIRQEGKKTFLSEVKFLGENRIWDSRGKMITEEVWESKSGRKYITWGFLDNENKRVDLRLMKVIDKNNPKKKHKPSLFVRYEKAKKSGNKKKMYGLAARISRERNLKNPIDFKGDIKWKKGTDIRRNFWVTFTDTTGGNNIRSQAVLKSRYDVIDFVERNKKYMKSITITPPHFDQTIYGGTELSYEDFKSRKNPAATDIKKARKVYDTFNDTPAKKLKLVDRIDLGKGVKGEITMAHLCDLTEFKYSSAKETGGKIKERYIHKLKKHLPIYTNGKVLVIPLKKQEITARGFIHSKKNGN